MQMQNSATYENVKRIKNTTSCDSDQQPPYRTEMSLVLSYNGNKSKYCTSQYSDKIQESDIDTPPPSLPHAMKLLPNKLTYAGNNELFKPIQNAQDLESGNAHMENSTNEHISTKSKDVKNEDKNGNEKKSNGRKNEKNNKNGEHFELKSNGNTNNLNLPKCDDSNSPKISTEFNDAHESVSLLTKSIFFHF